MATVFKRRTINRPSPVNVPRVLECPNAPKKPRPLIFYSPHVVARRLQFDDMMDIDSDAEPELHESNNKK